MKETGATGARLNTKNCKSEPKTTKLRFNYLTLHPTTEKDGAGEEQRNSGEFGLRDVSPTYHVKFDDGEHSYTP